MKKRFLSVVLAVGLILSLVPCAAAALPDDVTYYEQNPYTNAKLTGKDENGVYHYKITIAADKEKQSVPLLLGSLYANVTTSDKTVVGTTYDSSCDAYLGKAPGTATVTLSLGVYQSSRKEPQAVIDVTVLSPEDFAAYTGDDATHAVKGHTHTMIERETVDNTRGKLLVRKICTECGYWYNWSYENLPGWTKPGTNPGTEPGTTPEPGPSTNPGSGTTNGPAAPGTTSNNTPDPYAIPVIPKKAARQRVNTDRNNYRHSNRSQPMGSYLYENETGGLTLVEKVARSIRVENYDSSFNLLSGCMIPGELDIFGGFYAGQDYNFFVFAKNNLEENKDAEVMRIVKYSKDWRRLGSASISDANMKEPLRAGSLRCAEYGGYLYVHSSRTMFKSGDGLNHQSNSMIVLRESDMAVTEKDHGGAYVSHSFNQFVLVDKEGHLVTLNQGDAYPRSLVLSRFNAKAGQDSLGGRWNSVKSTNILDFPGAVGDNETGCSVGGFAETSNGYVAAYNYSGTGKRTDPYDVYLAFTDKNLNNKIVKVSTGMDTYTPQLAPLGPDSGYVLWRSSDFGTVFYAPYSADGTVGATKSAKAILSDCTPILWNGKAVWYTCNNSLPVFYTMDRNGLTAHEAGGAAYQNSVRLSTQTVLLDGKPVTFQTCTLTDSNNGVTNFIKLRDMAHYINGTRAQFEVTWTPGSVGALTGQPYTPNGSELTIPSRPSAPNAKTRYYKENTNKFLVDGVPQGAEAIVITDGNGGDHTYFKLRDLGSKLGFNVSYINKQVVINTNEPYSDAQ